MGSLTDKSGLLIIGLNSNKKLPQPHPSMGDGLHLQSTSVFATQGSNHGP